MEFLKHLGAPIRISSNKTESVFDGALIIIEGRGWLKMQDNLCKAEESAIVMLEYYANSVVHWHVMNN